MFQNDKLFSLDEYNLASKRNVAYKTCQKPSTQFKITMKRTFILLETSCMSKQCSIRITAQLVAVPYPTTKTLYFKSKLFALNGSKYCGTIIQYHFCLSRVIKHGKHTKIHLQTFKQKQGICIYLYKQYFKIWLGVSLFSNLG